MPLNDMLRKCTGRYKLHKLQEKNQSPNVHGQHWTVCQKWKTIGNPNTGSEDIGMEFGIEKYAILIMKSGKRQMIEGIEHYQTCKDERKN